MTRFPLESSFILINSFKIESTGENPVKKYSALAPGTHGGSWGNGGGPRTTTLYISDSAKDLAHSLNIFPGQQVENIRLNEGISFEFRNVPGCFSYRCDGEKPRVWVPTGFNYGDLEDFFQGLSERDDFLREEAERITSQHKWRAILLDPPRYTI